MNTRVESESYNPLAEFFEQQNQEDESRGRGRAINSRYRRKFANRTGRFRPPRVFRRQFFQPFPPPRPWPFPFPLPPVTPPWQPVGQVVPPPQFAPSGGAAPMSDSWDPQGAVDEPAPDVNGQGATDPGDGDMGQAAGNDQEFFEFGAYDRESSGRTINLPTIVICGGKPFASLDNFSFGKSTLRNDGVRQHQSQINAIAAEIKNRAARGRPVPTVCIEGRTDLVGAQDYNYTLGLERAKSVKAALCKALGAHANSITYVVSSLGEMDPTPGGASPAARARNRRVDVHLLSERQDGERCATAGGRQPQPATGTCSGIEKFTIDDYGRGVSQLSSSQQAKISTIKNAIRKRARKCGGISIVEIRGHASTEGPAGRNKNLGQARADVVKGALSVTLRGARVFATSKGEAEPLVTPDNTDTVQRKNRRVEIFVM